MAHSWERLHPGSRNGSVPPPDTVERRVERLRDDVARLVGELERRYHHAVELPKRIEERSDEATRQVGHVLQRSKWPLLALAVAGSGAGLWWMGARWRRRRRLAGRAMALLSDGLSMALVERRHLERALPAWLR